MEKGLVIVGAAIIDDAGRVLAAQRSEPPRTAGMWEFPGGKVENGETELEALARECREELDVAVEIGERLGPDIPLSGGHAMLRVWLAKIVDGVPRPMVHRELRWLSLAELDAVAWLPADAPLLDELRTRLNEYANSQVG